MFIKNNGTNAAEVRECSDCRITMVKIDGEYVCPLSGEGGYPNHRTLEEQLADTTIGVDG